MIWELDIRSEFIVELNFWQRFIPVKFFCDTTVPVAVRSPDAFEGKFRTANFKNLALFERQPLSPIARNCWNGTRFFANFNAEWKIINYEKKLIKLQNFVPSKLWYSPSSLVLLFQKAGKVSTHGHMSTIPENRSDFRVASCAFSEGWNWHHKGTWDVFVNTRKHGL